ncbi:MAG: FG-GAP-like repeat-containing protein [Cyclobacteriaceae bacterium]
MRRFFLILLVTVSFQVFGQQPVIDAVQPVSNYPNLRLLIQGRGFSSTSAQLQVWFGSVKGVITMSTEFAIEVTVPPQARLENVEVIHLVSRLAAKSIIKFTPVYSGEGFDPSKLETLVEGVSRFTGDRVFDICSCDLDMDGKPDLTGSKDDNMATDLLILKNNSTLGSFAFNKFDKSNLDSLNLMAPTGNITCGDLNGDGKPEIVAARSGTTTNSIFVLLNKSTPGTLSFGKFKTFNLDNAVDIARQVVIHDLNSDGKSEIIVANSTSNTIYVFQNQSSGGVLNINPIPVKITVLGSAGVMGIEVQDFTGDGKPDIAANSSQGADVFFIKNQSSSTISFGVASKLTFSGFSFRNINSADFNRDGKLDIALTSILNARLLVLLNQSTSSNFIFTTAATLTTDGEPFGVEVNDINGDHFPDIIVPARATSANAINVFLHNGSMTPGFTRVNVPTAKKNWFAKVGDLDGDAKPDIAFTSFNSASTLFSVDILRNKNCHVPKILNEGPLKICPGQTIRLFTIPIPGVTFNWNDGSTNTSTGSTPYLDITAAGNYTVTATGEAGACAVASSPVFAVTSGVGTIPPDPTISSNAPLCTGSTLNLSTGTVAGATYIWEGPDSFTSAAEDPSLPGVTPIQSGIYSLQLKNGDCLSNKATHRVDIVDLASFSVVSNAPSGVICQGQTAILSVNSESGYTYQWIKDGTDMGGQTGTSLNVTAEGAYTVRITRSAAPTCSVVTSPAIDVDVYTMPVASFTADLSACVSEQISFAGSATADNRATVAYSWDFGDSGSSTTQNPTHAYGTAQTFNPILTVSYSGIAGCTDTDTKSIVVVNGIQPTITSDVPEICPGETAVLSVTGTFASFDWSTNESTSSISVTSPNTYSVNTVDMDGCPGTDDIEIQVKSGCGDIDLDIPPVFSPNQDGNYDTWDIEDIENFPDCTMSVFDGRGRRVYQQKGYPATGWTGDDVPAGTYYYVFSCPTGKPLTGAVQIIR